MKTLVLSILFLVFTGFTFITSGQDSYPEKVKRKKFFVGMETGVGSLNLSKNNLIEPPTARFALGFNGGYIPFERLRIGINLGGWLIEPYSGVYINPVFVNFRGEKGESIYNSQIFAEVFPIKGMGLFLNLQGGFSKYINNRPDGYKSKGSGAKAGLGYEYVLGKNLGLSLVINYGFGRFRDVTFPGISVLNQRYDVVEIMVRIKYP